MNDRYSEFQSDYYWPEVDKSQDYEETEINHNDGVYKFVTYRKLINDDKE